MSNNKSKFDFTSCHTLFENITDLAYIYDDKGNIIYLNHAFEKISGHKPEEYIGKPFAPLFDEKNLEKATEEYRRTLKGESTRFEVHFKESGVLCAYSNIPYRDEAGKIIGVLGTARDITAEKCEAEKLTSAFNNLELQVNAREEELRDEIEERKKAEELIKESAEKFRSIFESSNDAIMLLNKREFFDCNDATLRIFGCSSKEDFVGRHPGDWSPELQPDGRNSRSAAKEKMSEAYRIGRNFFEWTHLRANGEEFPAEVLLTPMKLKGREILQATVRDITERKEAEDAHRKSEQLLLNVLDNSTTIVYVKDIDGRYLLINSIFEKLFHVDRKAILYRTDHDIFPEDMARAFRANDLKVIEAGNPIEFEEVAPHDDGPHTYISIKFPLNDKKGNPYAVCGISTDITERKRSAERIETLNKCFLDFGTDPIENITRLTSLLGTLMKGTCALYNRLKDGLLYSTGQWQTPPGYNSVNTPEGRICFDVIKNKGDDIFYITNLSKTPYAKTDTNVIKYNLETYLGKAVTCNGVHVGSLCVVFQEEFIPSEVDIRYLEIIAVAIGIEEERKQAGEELATSREKLRDLSLHLQTMQEQERARIARDIHDDLGQILTALDFDIAYMTKRLLPDQKELIEKAKKMSALIKVSTQTVQRIASELRPALLDDLGLMAAMEWQAEEFHEHTGIDCKVSFDTNIEIDNRELSTALFRAFQETLTNAARHSNATNILAGVSKSHGCLVLKVSDNGKGIKDDDIFARDSFGLSAMRERFYPFSGKITIEGTKNRGTIIRISVPLGDSQ